MVKRFDSYDEGIELTPADRPDLKRPTKGRKKWRNKPQLIVTVF